MKQSINIILGSLVLCCSLHAIASNNSPLKEEVTPPSADGAIPLDQIPAINLPTASKQPSTTQPPSNTPNIPPTNGEVTPTAQ
jgi:hypothetical protein